VQVGDQVTGHHSEGLEPLDDGSGVVLEVDIHDVLA